MPLENKNKQWLLELYAMHPKLFISKRETRKSMQFTDRFGNTYHFRTKKAGQLFARIKTKKREMIYSADWCYNDKKMLHFFILDKIPHIVPQTRRAYIIKKLFEEPKDLLNKEYADIAKQFYLENADVFMKYKFIYHLHMDYLYYPKYRFQDKFGNEYEVLVANDDKDFPLCYYGTINVLNTKTLLETPLVKEQRSAKEFHTYLNNMLDYVPQIKRERTLKKLLKA